MLTKIEKKVVQDSFRDDIVSIAGGKLKAAGVGFVSVCVKCSIDYDSFLETRKEDKDFDGECAKIEARLIEIIGEIMLAKAIKDGDSDEMMKILERLDPKYRRQAAPQPPPILNVFAAIDPLQQQAMAEEIMRTQMSLAQEEVSKGTRVRKLLAPARSGG